jgi:hypothetical protein
MYLYSLLLSLYLEDLEGPQIAADSDLNFSLLFRQRIFRHAIRDDGSDQID